MSRATTINHGAPATQPDTTARQIVGANTDRFEVTIANVGTQTVYLGHDANVTVASGTPLPVGADVSYVGLVAVYGITASGAASVRFWEDAT